MTDQNTSIDTDSALTTEPVVYAEPLHQTVTKMDNILIHAEGIKTAWSKSVAAFIETGQLLLQSKKALSGSGKWLKLFDKDIGNLPFGIDTAERLMRIARNKVLLDSANWRNLPPSIRTLEVLTHASAKELEAWIADGLVTAETERSTAEKLVDTKKVKKVKAVENDTDDSNTSESDDTATDDSTAIAATTNEQHVINHLKGLFRLLGKGAGVDWHKILQSNEGLCRDVICELKGRIEEYDEDVERDKAFDEAHKLN